MIVTQGKQHILRYFAGLVPTIANEMVYGIGSTAENLADTDLAFEAARVSISSIAADLVNNRLVFNATLPINTVGTVYEVGLYYTDSTVLPARTLSLPGLNQALWTNATFTTTNTRVSPTGLKVDFVASGTTTAEYNSLNADVTEYGGADTIVIGFHGTTNLSSLRVRLGSDSANYYEFVMNSPVVGYNIYKLAISSATKTGNPDWANIKYVAVRPSGTSGGSGSVYFDVIRFQHNSLSTNDLLVARKVLATPYVSNNIIPNSTEFSLAVSVT